MKKLFFLSIFFCVMVVNAQNWQKTFADAQTLSKKTNRPIVLVFAGSDWCAPCIKLDRDIWQSEEFKKYAEENYVLYKADFPRRTANKLSEGIENQHKLLADKYNPKGYFPLVVVLNVEGNKLGETGYKKVTPNEYISVLNEFLE
ncbi:thioredoxin family protein [Cellulophaga sp. E16_2]|uniref:thioredoxin family protein n=1 Tax=Cellulophaga sp. E16_2 TaxID=2789297 RepID=UPI001A921BC3|nr:thioredoxin family protein [Cellulophaga sp. E16_2]MBO0590111.1 thioredoxin family protein [Cellulophaga sp. E16_2]